MCDPVLDFGSLYVGEKAQYSTVGLCHCVDLIIETPVDLPLGKEQLCPFSLSIEYLRGVSHKFGPSCGLSWSWTATACRWSTAPSSWWSTCTSWWSTSESSSSASRWSSSSTAAAAADGWDVGCLCGCSCC